MMTPVPEPADDPAIKIPETKIQRIIAVASGKGGVGKSTLTVLLAHSLKSLGLRVGILDADIYGPSIPTMLGRHQQPDITTDKHMIPLQNHGIFFISMGLLIDTDSPVIWRGPMISKALQQMFYGVAWPSLDVLLLDLPPGTGDVQLTLVQKFPITGAIVVSTSQDIAIHDAVRGTKMFQKTGISVLGLVENMSLFSCPHCQHTTPIFDHQRVQGFAEKLGVPFLGSIPLVPEIRQWMDTGMAPDFSKLNGTLPSIAKKLVS